MRTLPTLATIALLTINSCFRGTADTVQYVTLVNTNFSATVQYSIQTNQVVALVGTAGAGTVTVVGTFAGGPTVKFPPPSTGPFQLFTGLTTVGLLAGNVTNCATLRVTTPNTANVISNYVPADAIVVPSSVVGPVQIILESSTDLVNWTAASPGTYGSTAGTNRFFRVRAVAN